MVSHHVIPEGCCEPCPFAMCQGCVHGRAYLHRVWKRRAAKALKFVAIAALALLIGWHVTSSFLAGVLG